MGKPWRLSKKVKFCKIEFEIAAAKTLVSQSKYVNTVLTNWHLATKYDKRNWNREQTDYESYKYCQSLEN